jgi:photosystem II stability/assembly factor-like uncharacterized protein
VNYTRRAAVKTIVRGILIVLATLTGPMAVVPVLAGHDAVETASWHWENPLPAGNNIAQIACVPTGACYAAGDGGTILVSRAARATWTALHSGTTSTLASIACPSASICYAAGAGGLILATQDGGATWTAQQVGKTYQLNRLTCPAEATCYAVGGDAAATCVLPGCPLNGAENVVLVTRDAGKSWTRLHPLGDDPVAGIACPTADICWLAGGDSIQYTVDGGRTWVVSYRYQPPAGGAGLDLTAVACPGPSTCYAVGGGGAVGTTDAGKTWTRIDVSVDGHAGSLTDIACPTDRLCFMTGGAHSIYRLDHGRVQRTTNGAVGQGARVTCASSTTCYIAGYAGSILSTVDGGQSWHDFTRGPRENLKAVVCPAAGVCRALGAGPLLATEDGGRQWVKKAAPHLLLSPYLQGQEFACPTARECVVAGENGTVAVTRDGGATWQEPRNPMSATPMELTAASCPSSAICYIAGSGCLVSHCLGPDVRSVILKTADGGRTWRQVFVRRDNLMLLEAIACPTLRICFVSGSPGRILATVNGGQRWREETSPARQTGTDLPGLTCPSASVCYAVGWGCRTDLACPLTGFLSVILVTTDGGRHWTAHDRHITSTVYGRACGSQGVCITSVALSAVACAGRSTCRAVGGDGTILRTADGGKTWRRESSGTRNFLSGLACLSASTCIAVGPGGTIVASGSGP